MRAVALFAALSYAITRSSRGGGDITKEDLNIQASSFISWGASAKQTALRMQMTEGVGENGFGFNGAGGNVFANFNCPDTTGQHSCQFFAASGWNQNANRNGIKYLIYPKKFGYPTDYTGVMGRALALKIDGVGLSDKAELIYTYPVTQALCRAINQAIGLALQLRS